FMDVVTFCSGLILALVLKKISGSSSSSSTNMTLLSMCGHFPPFLKINSFIRIIYLNELPPKISCQPAIAGISEAQYRLKYRKTLKNKGYETVLVLHSYD